MVKSTNMPLPSKEDVMNHALTAKGAWGHSLVPDTYGVNV